MIISRNCLQQFPVDASDCKIYWCNNCTSSGWLENEVVKCNEIHRLIQLLVKEALAVRSCSKCTADKKKTTFLNIENMILKTIF